MEVFEVRRMLLPDSEVVKVPGRSGRPEELKKETLKIPPNQVGTPAAEHVFSVQLQ